MSEGNGFTPRRRRGRPRKAAAPEPVEFAAPGGALVRVASEGAAPVEFIRRAPGQDELEHRIKVRVDESLAALPADSPFAATKDVAARIAAWHATPFEWRWPKTDVELADELKLTPLRLRVMASMLAACVENARREIRRACEEHAQLRSLEALDGMVYAAHAGNAPAFDRVMQIGWKETASVPAAGAPLLVEGGGVRGDLRSRLLEKLGV